ncbi:MAG: DUF3365 domain-containing protein [Flavobacteriales bacterium]|nr:DUF3365 domain-containing protein [Flavobacteriales bacterium]
MGSKAALLCIVLALHACTMAPDLDEAAAMEKGAAIANSSFQALSTALQAAMKQGGPVHAVEFCSLNALPLTDSLSMVHSARIRRTSERWRALRDAPDAEEMKVLRDLDSAWNDGKEGGTLKPILKVGSDSVAYYQPIFITTPTCLKCHGKVGDGLDSAAHASIAQLYTWDKATGYSLGDLRGMWSIRWAR